MPAPTNNDLLEPALGSMLVVGGTIEGYVHGIEHSQIDNSPAHGMVLHWASQVPEGTITGSLWRERGLAERFMANVLADTITEVVATDRERDRTSPDFSYSMLSIVGFVAGADADLAIGRKVGGADGAVLVRPRADRGRIEYLAIAKSLGLEDAAPPGMIAHVAASEGDEVRWIDLWLDRAAPAAFYEEGGIASESLELLPLHTVFVNAEELKQLPRFPRGENHLHF
ncbi:MAG: hypothetical protein ACRDKE_04025 [Solirubrobacterales bacterium]